jgi:HEAT repeat protein
MWSSDSSGVTLMNRRTNRWLLGIGLVLGIAIAVVFTIPATREWVLHLFRGEQKQETGQKHDGKTLPEWVQQLKSSVVEEQRSACYAIQYFRSEDAVVAVPALMDLLKSKDWSLRMGAAYALGRIGRPAREAVLPLAELLADPQPQVRVNAAESLDFMSDPQAKAAVPALTSTLDKAVTEKATEETEINFRLYVARALGKIGPEARPAVPSLTTLVASKDQYLRAASAEALGQIGPEAKTAVPVLTTALDDAESMVRLQSALALWRIERSEKSVPVLLGLFKDDKSAYVRVEAAGALGKIGESAKAAIPTLQDAAENDPTRGVNGRYEVRTAAKSALKLIER